MRAKRENEELYGYQGEEHGYTYAPCRLCLRLGEKDRELAAADAAHFCATKSHRLFVQGGEAEVILIAITVPHPLSSSYM